MGPTPRTASISPDVNDPGARNIDFARLAADYRVAANALLAMGVSKEDLMIPVKEGAEQEDLMP